MMQLESFRSIVGVLFISLLILISGCNSPSDSGSATLPTDTTPATPPPGALSPTPTTELPRLDGKATVVLQVKGQPITIEVDGTAAPVTAGNFVDLVNRGVYEGLSFHRVEPGFVVQGGDPQSKDPQTPPELLGTGGFIDPQTNQPRTIPLEITPAGGQEPIYSETLTQAPQLTHRQGAVAMARSQLPDSASSQFYIALNPLPDLDGKYAVFGYVTDGMAVVEQIQRGDRIDSAEVTAGLENLKGGATSPQ